MSKLPCLNPFSLVNRTLRGRFLMTPEIVFFACGSLLILIGIFGSGFEVRELKIPKVGPGVRILAAVGGLAFITLGIGIQCRDTTPEKANSSPVNFTISDVIGDEQVSEQITVVIDGRNVGDLTVNEQDPRSTITVTVPREGKYSYVLDASAVFKETAQSSMVSVKVR